MSVPEPEDNFKDRISDAINDLENNEEFRNQIEDIVKQEQDRQYIEHNGSFGGSAFPNIDGNGNGHGHDKRTNYNNKSKLAEDKEKESCSKILVNLALEHISQLFKDQYGYPFASIKTQDHNEIVAIESSKFKRFLFKIYYYEFEDAPYSEALNNTIQVLSAKALFDGPTFHLSLRVASSKDKSTIYYDLTNDDYQIVEISKTGWEVKKSEYILFTRYNQTPQVLPDRNYNDGIFEEYIKSTNVKGDNNKLLLKVYIVSLFIPDIPHPIFHPHGEKGSGKSTDLTKIKRLVDPAKPELLTVNNKQEEFVQQLNHNYVAIYDNIKHTPLWLSDEACKAVTGVGNTKRKLYSDDEDIVYEYKRCLGFNGVNIALTEPDALDRSIMIELERIKNEDRKLELEVYTQFEVIRPKLLGCIFDIIVKTLQIKDSIKLDNLPRMADFALWGESISRVMGNKPLEFINAYYENIGKQNIEVIDSNPLGQVIVKLCDEIEVGQEKEYHDTVAKSLIKLREIAEANNIDINSKYFPKSANSLSRRLKSIRSNLLEGLGIEAIIDRDTKSNTSFIKVRKISPVSPASPESENSCSNPYKISGDIASTGDIISPDHKIPPVQNDIIRAQITSDIDDSGGPEVPEVLLQPSDKNENVDSEPSTQFEKPEVCSSCDKLIDPFNKNTHTACCKGQGQG